MCLSVQPPHSHSYSALSTTGDLALDSEEPELSLTFVFLLLAAYNFIYQGCSVNLRFTFKRINLLESHLSGVYRNSFLLIVP